MEEISFENSRGVELAANFWKGCPGVVMAHSFTGDRTEGGYFLEVAERLEKAGFGVLAFDFSGHGESSDEPISLEKEVEDLESAVRFMGERCGKVGIFSYSLGGLAALKMGEDVDALFLTSPPTRGHEFKNRMEGGLEKVDDEVYRFSNPRGEHLVDRSLLEDLRTLDQEALLGDVDAPLKLVHGEEDSIVPVEDSRRAAEKVPGAELLVLEGVGHVYRGKVREVAEEAVEWFEKNL